MEIRPLGTVFTVEGEPGETYAGNYDRGSEAYEKFADFVRERAVGQETPDRKRICWIFPAKEQSFIR